MHAFVVARDGHAVEDVELPSPTPRGREIRLKVTCAGVCHTDVHLQHGGYDLGTRGKLRLVDRGVSYPLVMGHEIVGVVDQVGESVTTARVGDVRLIFPWIGCGGCRACVRGEENACPQGRSLGVFRPGGYAEYVLVPDERYLVDVDGIDNEWAATLACSGLTAYGAINRLPALESDEVVVVIGVGGVGLSAIAMLTALGHRSICAVDVSEQNLATAEEIGASITVLSTGSELSAQIIAACGGPVLAVVDFVNNGTTAIGAFDSLMKGGHLVQVGLFGGELAMPTALVPLKMATIHGSYAGTLDELHAVVRLAKSGALPRIPITAKSFTARSVEESLRQLTQLPPRGRIVLSRG